MGYTIEENDLFFHGFFLVLFSFYFPARVYFGHGTTRWQRVNFRFHQNHLFKWDKIMPNLYKMYWPEATCNRNSTFYSWPNFSIFLPYLYNIYIGTHRFQKPPDRLTYRLNGQKFASDFSASTHILCYDNRRFAWLIWESN